MGILDWDIGEVEIGRRNDDKLFSWEKLNLNNYIVDKPTVFCLSGNATITTKEANGLCKQAEIYLDLIKHDKDEDIKDRVDIVGIKYAKTAPGSEVGRLTPDFVEKFNNKVLVPLFKDENGKKLDLNTAMKNMSKITFFSYCVGAREINDIMETLNFKLGKLGYTDSEIKLIDNAGKHVSFAPFDISRSYLPTIRFVSTQDRMVGEDVQDALTAQGVHNFDGVMITRDEPQQIYGKHAEFVRCGAVNVFSSKLLNSFEDRGDEHFISIVNRDKDWNVRPFLRGVKRLSSDNADCVSQMMAWSLCRAAENSFENEKSETFVSSNFTAVEMQDELESIKDAFGERLGISEEHKSKRRRKDYKSNGFEYTEWMRKKTSKSTFCEPKTNIYSQLSHAQGFEEIAYIFEKNNYYYMDEFLPMLDLKKEEIVALECASKERQKNREKNKWNNNQMALLVRMQSAKSMEEVENLAMHLNRKTTRTDLLWLANNVKEGHPLTYENALILCDKLTKEWKAEEDEKSNSFWKVMTGHIEKIDKSGVDKFRKTLGLFEKKDYFAVSDILSQCTYLDDTQKGIIKSMEKAKKRARDHERNRVHLPDFEEVKWKVSNASSIEEMIEIFAENNYYGVEYIVPEIVVLTEEEKKEVLRRCEELREEMNGVM